MLERTVSFTRMAEGTREEYQMLAANAAAHPVPVADNVLALLEALRGHNDGYRVDRYGHSLQTATRALRDGADDEMVCAALLHDIGDLHAPHNHSAFAAAILRPYVSENTFWIVQHHGVFQGYYYFHHHDLDRNARDRLRDHPMYEATAAFCERWDQCSFDPDYDTLPVETFVPMVRRLFANRREVFV
ncbi:MAG: HD domain-containing protein [Alphaproteobacteria bacterium]